MATERRERFIRGQLAMMLATIILLTLLGSFSMEFVVIISLIGFLLLIELTAPRNVSPRWRKRLRWIIVFSMVLFGYIVLQRLRTILPTEVI